MTRTRTVVTTVLDLLGLALIVAAATLWDWRAGVAVLGAAIVAVSAGLARAR